MLSAEKLSFSFLCRASSLGGGKNRNGAVCV